MGELWGEIIIGLWQISWLALRFLELGRSGIWSIRLKNGSWANGLLGTLCGDWNGCGDWAGCGEDGTETREFPWFEAAGLATPENAGLKTGEFRVWLERGEGAPFPAPFGSGLGEEINCFQFWSFFCSGVSSIFWGLRGGTEFGTFDWLLPRFLVTPLLLTAFCW